MPAINITDEQARALARGEDVTIKPERKLRTVVITFTCTGNVFTATTYDDVPQNAEWGRVRVNCESYRKVVDGSLDTLKHFNGYKGAGGVLSGYGYVVDVTEKRKG